jgi:hypothetical protein
MDPICIYLFIIFFKAWKSVMAAEQSSEGYLNIIAELERKQEEIRDAYALVSEDFEEEQAENDRMHSQNHELKEMFNHAKQTNENLQGKGVGGGSIEIPCHIMTPFFIASLSSLIQTFNSHCHLFLCFIYVYSSS